MAIKILMPPFIYLSFMSIFSFAMEPPAPKPGGPYHPMIDMYTVAEGQELLSMAKDYYCETSSLINEMRKLAGEAYVMDVSLDRLQSLDSQFQNLLGRLDGRVNTIKWKDTPVFKGELGEAISNGWAHQHIPARFPNPPIKLDEKMTRGHVTGVVSGVTVGVNGDMFDVCLFLGAREFRATVRLTDSGEVLALIDTLDSENVIGLAYDNIFKAVGVARQRSLTSADEFKRALKLYLKGRSDHPPSVVSFSSGHCHKSHDFHFDPGLNTPKGVYALSYDEVKREFKLTDGFRPYLAFLDEALSKNPPRIDFPNDISIILHKFDSERPLKQITYTVSGNKHTVIPIKDSPMPEDIIKLSVHSLTASSLGLYGLSILSSKQAHHAIQEIDKALLIIQDQQLQLLIQASHLESGQDLN